LNPSSNFPVAVRFPIQRLRRVHDYVEAHLDEDLLSWTPKMRQVAKV